MSFRLSMETQLEIGSHTAAEICFNDFTHFTE